MALEIFESLSDVEQAKVKGIVSSIREHLSVEGEGDLDLLMATLEQLNEGKREARDLLKAKEKEITYNNRDYYFCLFCCDCGFID